MNKNNISRFMRAHTTEVSAAIALLILCAVLSLVTENFLTQNNLFSVLHQVSYIAIMSVGVSFLIQSGNIDLSVTATLALSVTVMGELYCNRGWSASAAILMALLIGIVCGVVNSAFITKLKLLPFIVTLATMNIFRGAASIFTNGYSAQGMPAFIQWIGKGKIGEVPAPVVVMFLVYILAWFIQKKTSFGLSLYATGGNSNAAKLSGIRTERVRLYVYMINGLLAAVAGMILAGRMNSTNSSMATGVEMDCIAAAAIGGTSMTGGVGNIWGTLIGALLMGVVRNGLNLLGMTSFWQQVALGCVVLLAVTIDSVRRMSKKS